MELEKFKEIIQNVLGVDTKEITLDSTFESDLGADSLDLLQIVMEVETELNIKLDTDKLNNIKTVGDAIKAFEEYSK